MYIKDDYIVKTVGARGRRDKFYRMRCNNCGADRGYLLKAQDRRLKCNKCARTGAKLSKETKDKMSESALTRQPRQPKKVDGRSTRCTTTYARGYGVSEEHRTLRHRVKTLLNQKLKRRSIRKSLSIYGMFDFTIEELKQHLESKFQEGMSWENYGKDGWHIDHIVPDSWFSYDSHEDEDFKRSWSLDNLQPLWAEDNLQKSNKFIGGVSFQPR